MTIPGSEGIERKATVWPEEAPIGTKRGDLYTRVLFEIVPGIGHAASRGALAAMTAAVTRDKGIIPVTVDVTANDDASTCGTAIFGYPEEIRSTTCVTVDGMKDSIDTALGLISPGGLEIEYLQENPSTLL